MYTESQQKSKKIAIIPFANTIIKPWTMMVKGLWKKLKKCLLIIPKSKLSVRALFNYFLNDTKSL